MTTSVYGIGFHVVGGGDHPNAITLADARARLGAGRFADLCVFDPASEWTVTDQALRSQGKHTPFSGYELPGCVRATLVGGHVAFERG